MIGLIPKVFSPIDALPVNWVLIRSKKHELGDGEMIME